MRREPVYPLGKNPRRMSGCSPCLIANDGSIDTHAGASSLGMSCLIISSLLWEGDYELVTARVNTRVLVQVFLESPWKTRTQPLLIERHV